MADKKAVNTAAQAQSDKTKKTSFFGKASASILRILKVS